MTVGLRFTRDLPFLACARRITRLWEGILNWYRFEQLSSRDLYAVVRLRESIFVVEQQCAYQDADGLDVQAEHLLVADSAGDLTAYLRTFGPGQLRDEAVIGRVVVRADQRGTGLGRRLMVEGARRLCDQHGPTDVFVSAQAHLAPWYRSLGYDVCGEGYDEDDIPHLPMRRPA